MPLRKLLYSGSNAELASLRVDNAVSASQFSGSFYGDGSNLTGIVASATPAGPNQSVQFNDGGSTSGSANFRFDKSGNIVYVTGSIIATSFTGSLLGSSSYALTSSYYPEIKTFGITIDGGGSVITTGVKGDITIPFACTIDSWYITADQAGSIVIDVWKDTLANFPPTVADSIAGTEKPTLSGVAFNSDTNLTTFTRSLAANDVIRFNVDSVATVTRINLVFKAVV